MPLPLLILCSSPSIYISVYPSTYSSIYLSFNLFLFVYALSLCPFSILSHLILLPPPIGFFLYPLHLSLHYSLASFPSPVLLLCLPFPCSSSLSVAPPPSRGLSGERVSLHGEKLIISSSRQRGSINYCSAAVVPRRPSCVNSTCNFLFQEKRMDCNISQAPSLTLALTLGGP